MQPCSTCGGIGIDGAGYCTTCGTFRVGPAPQAYPGPTTGTGAGWPNPGYGGVPTSGVPTSGVPAGYPTSGIPAGYPTSGAPGYAPPGYPTAGSLPPGYPATGGFAPPQPSRSGSFTWPLIALSGVLVVTVIAIAVIVVAKSGSKTVTLAADVDSCVVGTWRETSNISQDTDGNSWTSSGTVQKFRADGTGVYDYGSGITSTGRYNGAAAQDIYTGSLTYRYHNVNGVTKYSEIAANGSHTVTLNGVTKSPEPLSSAPWLDEKYTCAGDSMTQTNVDSANVDSYTIELKRTSHDA